MDDQQLGQLLGQAAGADWVPTLPDDLADRVRGRLARQRHRRRTLGGSSAVVVLLVAALGVWHVAGQTTRRADTAYGHAQPGAPGAGAPGISPVPLATDNAGSPLRYDSSTLDSDSDTPNSALNSDKVVALQAQIEQLQGEIARLEAKIKEDAARRQFKKRLAALRRDFRKPDPRDLVLAEIEKAASSGLHRAEACERRSRNDEARDEYQQVVSLFPNTLSAKVAQAKLGKTPSEKGDP
ncbi:MAG: hypothetical protein JW888_00490 [Pirellulales bacterium]|nr:hypothetical protein [Pirellulales bacterium]